MAVAALGCLAFAPAAQAVPSFSVAPEFPASVTVGDTGVPASVLYTATGDNTTAAGNPVTPLSLSNYIGLCNTAADVIPGTPPGECSNSQLGAPYSDGPLLTPSCAQVTDPSVATSADCQVADPGVFALSATATGSGFCAGTTFDVVALDAASSRVRFVPRAPATRLWLGQAGSSCRISFTFNVLKLPAGDASPATTGTQTRSISSGGGAYNASEVGGGHVKPAPLKAVGADLTTVQSRIYTCDDLRRLGLPLPPECRTTLSELMSASVSGRPRCASGPSRIPRAADSPFSVTVRVTGEGQNFLANVDRVEFRRNGRLIKTLRATTPGVVGGYRLRIDPSKLAPRRKFLPGGRRPNRRPASRRYTITSRVVLKAPGTFTRNNPSALVRNLRAIRFAAVRVCKDTPPPPPPAG